MIEELRRPKLALARSLSALNKLNVELDGSRGATLEFARVLGNKKKTKTKKKKKN